MLELPRKFSTLRLNESEKDEEGNRENGATDDWVFDFSHDYGDIEQKVKTSLHGYPISTWDEPVVWADYHLDNDVPPNPTVIKVNSSLPQSAGILAHDYNLGKSRNKTSVSRSRMKRTALQFLSNIRMETELEDEVNDVLDPTLDPLSEKGKLVFDRKVRNDQDGDESVNIRSSGIENKSTPESKHSNTYAIKASNFPGPGSDNMGIGIRLRGNSNYRYVSRSEKTTNILDDVEDTHGILGKSKAAVKSVAAAAVSSIIPSKPMMEGRRDLSEVKDREEWEQHLIDIGVHDSARAIMSWDKGYPSLVFSIIKYDASVETRLKKKMKLSNVMLEMPRRRKDVPNILSDATWLQRRWGTSYARYINETWAELSGDKIDKSKVAEEEAWDREYEPNRLDDPNIRRGKHRIQKSLLGYHFSILPYTKKKELKAELNDLFREQHPQLPASLTLSKIRNLKREVLDQAVRLDFEFSTVAMAYVYFEKLVFKGVVNKPNRKLVMSVCLILAFKFNETEGSNPDLLKVLLEDIERIQSISPKQILEAEFPVFGHLLFRLNIKTDHLKWHLHRILKTLDAEHLIVDFPFENQENEEEEEADSQGGNSSVHSSSRGSFSVDDPVKGEKEEIPVDEQ